MLLGELIKEDVTKADAAAICRDLSLFDVRRILLVVTQRRSRYRLPSFASVVLANIQPSVSGLGDRYLR